MAAKNADIVVRVATPEPSARPRWRSARTAENPSRSKPSSEQVVIGTSDDATGATLVFPEDAELEAGAEYAVTVRCAVGPVSRVGDEASPLVTVAAEKSGVLAGAELVLRIVKGGGLNTGTYQLSTDGGDNFERERTIPVDGKLTLSDFGVTVTFPDGSYTAGTTYECRLLAPRRPSWT